MPGPAPQDYGKVARTNAESQFARMERDLDEPAPPFPADLERKVPVDGVDTAREMWAATWANARPLLERMPTMVTTLKRACVLAAEIEQMGMEVPGAKHAQLTALEDRLGSSYVALKKMRVDFIDKSAGAKPAELVAMPTDEAQMTPTQRAKARAARRAD